MLSAIAFTSDFHRSLHERLPRDRAGLEAAWDMLFARDASLAVWRETWILSRLGTSPLDLELPWINFPAIEFLRSYLVGKQAGFEWGMGGSTLFLRSYLSEITSVEHDKAWFEKARLAIDAAAPGEGAHELVLEPPTNDPAGLFASGNRDFIGRSFERYVRTIDRCADESLDFVLVDGRARLACCTAAMGKLRIGGILMLDNSDYARYAADIEAFERRCAGMMERLDFLGPGPCSNGAGWQTTVWRRLSAATL